MASPQIQQHFRQYLQDGIDTKVRLGSAIEQYKEQENKTRERAIDQNTIVNQMVSAGLGSEKIQHAQERLNQDRKLLDDVQNILDELTQKNKELTMTLNTHAEELSQIEIDAGGFVTHAIGLGKGTSMLDGSLTIQFEENGHIEIPIGVRINKWNDSSHMTIKKIKKAGV